MYLWIAHGYIVSDKKESDFMHLLRRGFFQEATEDAFGEVQSCKMHDIMHDLALYVAGEESIMLSDTSSNTSSCLRHVSLILRSEPNELWAIPGSLLDCKWLRSFMLMQFGSICNTTNLNKLFTRFKLLRTLSLSGMGIESISPSIGEPKLLRYVDLSYNIFEELPASMTNLVNLVALNLMSCCQLRVWPQDFNKLKNIAWLNIEMCMGLKQMPPGIEKLTELQHLSDLKVGKASELDALAGFLQQLRGKLLIHFSDGLNEDGDECSWQLPISLQQLVIWWYPGIRIPGWGDNGRANNLARLEVGWCKEVKYLPHLRCLVNLRWLLLEELWELEFLEEEEIIEDKKSCCIGGGGSVHDNVGSIILPRLEVLTLEGLPKLKGWWRKEASCASVVAAAAQIPLLSELYIYSCPELELKSFPLCPHLRRLKFDRVDDSTPNSVLQQQQQELSSTIFYSSTSTPAVEDISIVGCKWVSRFQDRTLAFLRCLRLGRCHGLKSLHLASPHLQTIEIKKCDELLSIKLGEAPIVSLQFLKVQACKILHIINAGALDDSKPGLRTLEIRDCPDLAAVRLGYTPQPPLARTPSTPPSSQASSLPWTPSSPWPIISRLFPFRVY